MKFIKLTRILDPYDVRVGYYSGLAYPSLSPNQMLVPGYSTNQSSGNSASGGSFLQGVQNLFGQGQNQQQNQLLQSQNVQAQQNQYQSQLSQSNQIGNITYYNPSLNQHNNMAAQIPKASETQEIWIPIDQIKCMTKVLNQNYATLLKIDEVESYFIKEDPEQILKIIHNEEFNAKMDDILK